MANKYLVLEYKKCSIFLVWAIHLSLILDCSIWSTVHKNLSFVKNCDVKFWHKKPKIYYTSMPPRSFECLWILKMDRASQSIHFPKDEKSNHVSMPLNNALWSRIKSTACGFVDFRCCFFNRRCFPCRKHKLQIHISWKVLVF